MNIKTPSTPLEDTITPATLTEQMLTKKEELDKVSTELNTASIQEQPKLVARSQSLAKEIHELKKQLKIR